MNRNRQAGFTTIEVILLLAVVAIIAFVGWRIYETYTVQDGTQKATTTESHDDRQEIEDAGDLEEAEDYLNSTDIDSGLDTGELDATLEEEESE